MPTVDDGWEYESGEHGIGREGLNWGGIAATVSMRYCNGN